MRIKCWNNGSATHIIDIPREFNKARQCGETDYDEYEKWVWNDIRNRLKNGEYTKIETI